MDISTSVGNSAASGIGAVLRNLFADLFGSVKVTQSGLPFYEYNRLGQLYTVGAQDTALVATNAIAGSGGGVTASAQPIIGLFNPYGSGVDLVLLKTIVAFTTIGGTAVNPLGLFYLSGSTGNNPISTGTKNGGINCKTLLKAGSQATTFTGGATALTGLVGNLNIVGAVGIPPCQNTAGPATAATYTQSNVVDVTEGQYIVKQGQLLVVMNGTDTSAHASNVASSMYWAEIPTVPGS